MYEIHVTDREGLEHRVRVNEGEKLMDAIRDAGLPVDAACGGEGTCGTCHVHVEPAWCGRLPGIDDKELQFIEAVMNYEPGSSRLSCQIVFDKAFSGLKLTLADEE